jgi:hypothetical protein
MPYAMLRLKLALRDAMDEERKQDQDRAAAGSHQHTFSVLHAGQGACAGNTGQTAALCQNVSSCNDNEGRLAHSPEGASRDDKDTSRSRSSSHPLHHCATAIEGGVYSGSMDCVQADYVVSELALLTDENDIIQQEETSVTDMQDGFVVLSMVQSHGHLDASDQLASKTLPTTSKKMGGNPQNQIECPEDSGHSILHTR